MLKRPVVHAGAVALLALSGAAIANAAQQPTYSRSGADRECLARAMYFESEKHSEDGMLAVGTVVANRLKSGRYGTNYCSVVGQRNQFAPGVLTRGMGGEAATRARRVAEAVLSGHRHPSVKEAMFFHTAGLRFGYGNMHYLTVAGGNIFYEKRSAKNPAAARANALSMAKAYASARAAKEAAAPVLEAALRRKALQQAPIVLARVTAPAAPAPQPIRFGTAPLDSGSFQLASAYRGPEPKTTAANSALATVASLTLKKQSGPRVIAPAATVQASMTPTGSSAPTRNPMANFAVAQAWSSFN